MNVVIMEDDCSLKATVSQILVCLKEILDNLPHAWLTLQLGTQSVGPALSNLRCVRK